MEHNWRQDKIHLLRVLYGKTAKRYAAEKAGGDKEIFVCKYNMLMDAIQSLPDEPVTLVRVAMNGVFGDECRAMDAIRDKHEKGGAAGGDG